MAIDKLDERLNRLNKDEKLSNDVISGFAEIQVWFDEITSVIYSTRRRIETMKMSNKQIFYNGEMEKINYIFKNSTKIKND